ncbi:UNVERIFIED_CONTAM: hypothetical protein GTU68_062741 [Idotea baltica]|nr:hypothetical protein [Idotea baltica]
MKYIVCDHPGEFQLGEKSAPVAKEGEALLKMKRVGICGTDLHAYGGNQAFFSYPRILGHELAAEIIEVGTNDKGLKAGDKVGIMPYLSCGTCIACRKGKTNCCTNIKVLGVHTDGGMQEIITLPVDVLLPANDLSFEEIAIIEPLAIGAHAIRRAAIQPGEFALVIGCGPIGIGMIKFAQAEGAKVIAMDVNEDRLAYARESLGVDHTVNALQDPLAAIEKITGGELATAVFDATGNAKALMAGPTYMAHGGRYILVGLSKGELTFHHPSIHAKEISLLCSRNAAIEDFEYVMNNLRKGLFPVDSYITHTVGFEGMIDQFDSWLKPETGVIKAMVNW